MYAIYSKFADKTITRPVCRKLAERIADAMEASGFLREGGQLVRLDAQADGTVQEVPLRELRGAADRIGD